MKIQLYGGPRDGEYIDFHPPSPNHRPDIEIPDPLINSITSMDDEEVTATVRTGKYRFIEGKYRWQGYK